MKGWDKATLAQLHAAYFVNSVTKRENFVILFVHLLQYTN